jgi:AP-2 complex subunit mu-1
MMIFQFLSRLVDLIRSYCNGDFSEDVVKGNFVLIYELLDDVLDHGYPQLTDPTVAKTFIFQKGFATEATRRKRAAEAQSATLQVTGAVGWRKDGLRYKKNEVYLDAIETVNVLMSPQGNVLRTDVQGRIMMKAFLSGMPDIKIGLNDKLEDVTFHPCVNLGRWNAERVVSFVPPDGEFELAKYRCTEGIELPFKATALMTEQGRLRLDVIVKVKSSFDPKLWASNVVVLVPAPPQTARANFQVSAGKAKYDSKRSALVWKLKKFNGGMEHTLAANVELIATSKEKKPWGRPPLGLSFQIPMWSASGVRVQFMKVWEKTGYKVDKWVRKATKSGDYQIRLQ